MMGLLAALAVSMVSWAQEPFTVKVWPDGPAEDNGITADEKMTKEGRVLNARTAELFVYLPAPEKNTGAAVVICPGGGYARQAMQHEGVLFARMLAEKGIAGIILKYRLPNGHHAVPLADAQESMRIVRANAADWGGYRGVFGRRAFGVDARYALRLDMSSRFYVAFLSGRNDGGVYA